jgi:hypothetical protein
VPLVLAAALLACPKEKAAVKKTEPTPDPSPAAPDARAQGGSGGTSESPQLDRSAGSTPALRDEEICVDRWLSERKLDRYGSPQGTMYAGGTPLFNEATGKQVDRLEHVYKKHPEARAACAPASGTRRGRDAAP